MNTSPKPFFCVCLASITFFIFLFLYVICLQLQEEKKTEKKDNFPFYFWNLNNIFKANLELPFCYCSDNSQQWKVKGKIQEKRMISSFFISPRTSLNDFFTNWSVTIKYVNTENTFIWEEA